MKKNDKLIGICVDYTHDGLGIVKVEDFTFFIRDVIVEEEVTFVVTKMLKNYGYGKKLHCESPSIHRQDISCPYYARCGGCQIMHMNYSEQLRFKTNLVANNMKKIAKTSCEVSPTIGCKQSDKYRNKAQFPIQVKDGKVISGFYRLHSNEIIDMSHCLIQSDLINEIMQNLKVRLQGCPDAKHLRHVLIKHAFDQEQIMLVFISKKESLVHIEKILPSLVQSFPQIKSVILNINTRNDNVILGDKEIVLFGDSTICDNLEQLKFNISCKSFYQVNSKQTYTLYEQALQLANINEQDIVIDLYCGVGTISLFLAQKAKKVIGVEIVEKAVEDAKKNAEMNAIHNVEFVCSDAGMYAQKLQQEGIKPDVVVVDPPRKGCDDASIDAIVKMSPRRVVYVSCNPATLARDIYKFEQLGYKTTIIQPVDMFPNSYHVETCVLLSHKDPRNCSPSK